jgi:Cft2 family RNA processing exonuclease
LINLFKDKKPFNKKTRAILSKIEEINSMNKAESERNKNNCRSMSQTRKDSIGYGIVFSPFIVLIMPVIIPQYIFEQIKENDIFKKVKGISLNQSLAETEKTLGAPRRMNTKEGYKILSYSWSAQAPVYANYFFENDQLVGFISGFDSRPQTVIEQTK